MLYGYKNNLLRICYYREDGIFSGSAFGVLRFCMRVWLERLGVGGRGRGVDFGFSG